MGKPSERERREYIARSSSEQGFFARYTLQRHPAAQGYKRGKPGDRRREIRNAIIFLLAAVAVTLVIVVLAWSRGT